MTSPSSPRSGSARGAVVCIGETMVLVTPTDATPLRTSSHFALGVGGAESTVALYLADRGHRASWISRLGRDPLGLRIVDELRAYGVGVDAVQWDENAPTGVYFKDPDPQRTTVYYYRSGSAASQMDPSILDHVDWDGTRVVHLSGITAALSESCERMLRAAASQARQHGVLVSFDVNYRPALWPAAEAGPRLAEHARNADIVFVGRDEAENLWGIGDPRGLYEHLDLSGSLVVKDADIAASEVTENDIVVVPAHSVVVVEPVGAGDAFTAGYLSALLEGEDAPERLDRGHRFAARALGSTRDFVPA